MKEMLRRKFIALSAYIKKYWRSHISKLTAHLKTLEEKEAKAPKRRRQQEILKVKTEINKMETERRIETINETKSWFFEKIN